MQACFLPQYSPDSNPIELFFFLIESRLRRKGNLERVNEGENGFDKFLRLTQAVWAVTSEHAASFFHC